MEFKLTFIGTGSAFTKENCHTSTLIEFDDKKYLLDCGFKVPQALHDMGVKVEDINGVIISHVHADHTGGLEEMGLMGMYVYNKKFDLYVAEDVKDILWEKTLSGGMEDTVDKKLTMDDFFNVKTFEEKSNIDIDGLDFIPIKVQHVGKNKPCYSFIIGKVAYYSADTVFDKELLNIVSKYVEIIFHDCSFFPNEVHASLDQLITLDKEIKDKIFITHYGDNFGEYEDQIKSGGLKIAKRLDKFIFKI